jgi:hypothetical protein
MKTKEKRHDHVEIQQFDVFNREHFRVIPTDFLIKNLLRTDLWGLESSCFSGVNYDLLQCIEEITKAGQYPYNTTVGQKFCDKFNLGDYKENSFLSAMVYCTQKYKQDVQSEKAEKELHEKMSAAGFIRLTPELIKEVEGTKRKFFVLLNTTSFLGAEGKRESENKLILKSWGEQGPHWMNPRASRKGYRAIIGQYVKEAA